MNLLQGTVVAAALALAHAGAAAADDKTGVYAGVGLGKGTVEVGDFDADANGFKLFGGYQINEFLAVELAYIDGREPSISTEGTVVLGGDALLAVNIRDAVETTQINASAVGNYAFNDFFGVMGRLGVSFIDAEASQTVSSFIDPGVPPMRVDDDATELAYGVGLWAAPAKNLLLRLEYEMTSAELFDDITDEDTDISQISLSAVYRFGK